MKVVLLEHPRGNASLHFNDVANTPLSSCLLTGYLASYLCANGIAAEICDTHGMGLVLPEMVQTVTALDCDVLGVHLVYCWENTPNILKAINTIALRMEVPIIVYGFFPTFSAKTILESNPSISYAVLGEPEETFYQLLITLQSDASPDPVGGIAFRKGKTVMVKEDRPIIEDLDQLPFPIRTDKQLATTGHTILGSRGCYGNCTFCYINNFYGAGRRWRGRSPENVLREVKELTPRLPRKYIYFVDANFFGPGLSGQVRAEEIAGLLQGERELTFGLECRVNDIGEHSLQRLVGAGLRDVFLGIESASRPCLRRMRKETSPDQAIRAINLLRNYGIEPHIGFIMFDHHSTLEDLRTNFTFLASNRLLGTLTNTVELLYHPEIVLKGTDTYREMARNSTISLSPYSSYQGTYTYRDARVRFLADCISSISRYLLNASNSPHSPLYWNDDGAVAPLSYGLKGLVNEWIVGFFDTILTSLEAGAISITHSSKMKIIEGARGEIDKILSAAVSPEHGAVRGG